MKKTKRIAVIGTGMMGKWFARELSQNNIVAVYDTNPRRMLGLGQVKKLRRLEELASFQPELLLNAVSIQNTIAAFKKATPFIPAACTIADIASIKGSLADYYKSCAFPFVSIHPMFGPSFANLNKIHGENIIFINESDAKGKKFFLNFARQYDLHSWDFNFSEHDEMMAYSLTLPFASTIAFAACLKGQEVPGTTFARHLEIASRLLLEDDNLVTEILFNQHSLKRLETICMNMEFLKHVIRARDREEISKLLARLRRNIKPHIS
jgi:prephenate dehydrogenase